MIKRIMYIENKSTGEARIGRITSSRTGKTLYYKANDLNACKRFHSLGGQGISGNYFDMDSVDPDDWRGSRGATEYWISGCKKKGGDRHPCERSGPIEIDEDVREEYWTKIRNRSEQKDKTVA